MHKSYSISWSSVRAALVCAAGLLLQACAGESGQFEIPAVEEETVDAEGFYRTAFHISVGNAFRPKEANTRAADTYSPGSAYDNYIDMQGTGDLRLYFFTTDDAYLGTLDIEYMVPEAQNAISTRYYVMGKTDSRALFENDFKIMALANWGEYPQPEAGQKIDELLTATAEANIYTPDRSKPTPGPDNPIPMYGIKRHTALPDTEGLSDLGEINLLRSCAKITVTCPSDGWTLEAVSLTRHNKYGLKAPLGIVEEEQYLKPETGDNFTSSVSLPAAPGTTATSLSFEAAGTNTFQIYVPEYINTDPNGAPLDTRAKINLWFREVKELTDNTKLRKFELEIGRYDANKPSEYMDLRRNLWYYYEVDKSPEDYDLRIKADVIPFSGIDLKPSFGLEREDISGYVIVRDKKTGEILYWLDADNNKWYIVEIEGMRYVLAYVDPQHMTLDHWYDFYGSKHMVTLAGITGFSPVYDITDQHNISHYIDSKGNKYWLEMSEYYSVFVHGYKEGGPNPSGDALHWYDFMGNRHEMSEKEEVVLKDWIKYLKPDSGESN